MAFEVTVEPSGHRFTVEANETLLDAGLRAGINLQYGCSNGSCGECRARILSGTVESIRPHDFTFSQTDVAAGLILCCSTRPSSDLKISADVAGSPEEIPCQELVARVSKVERLQDEVVVLHLRTPRSQTLRFLAGQYVSLDFDGQGAQCLGIASCPCDGMNLRFHLRREPDRLFSDFVFDYLKRGAPVRIKGPHGGFVLDEASNRPILFIAGETGFAPIESLVEHAIALEKTEPMGFYWLSANLDGHYLSNYCRSWEDALDEFSYRKLKLAPVGELDWNQACDTVIAEHPDLADYDLYLSLVGGDGQTFQKRLIEAGARPDRVWFDPSVCTCALNT